MPRQTETVPIQPEVLEWARVSAGLDPQQAAAALGVSPQAIQQWESEITEFGITRIRQIAQAYKRPVTALLQQKAPILRHLPEDFRTIGSAVPHFSPETMMAIRDAQRIQEITAELQETEPEIFPQADIPEHDYRSDNPLEVGRQLRLALGVDVSTQTGWPSPNHAFNAWRAIFQSLGIVVLAKEMPRDDCRGFNISSVPVIVVNSREVDQAKIFTMAHEYGHLVLHRNGVCLERDHIDIERWCNRFAAAFLVPERSLIRVLQTNVELLDQVQPLAQRFKVSRHVIALRLMELGFADSSLYQAIKAEDVERIDWEKPPVSSSESFGRPQDAVRLSEVGVGYANVVLNAMESGRISAFDASEMLDLRIDKLNPLRDRVNATLMRYRR